MIRTMVRARKAPQFTRAEEVADRWIHIVGLALATVGLPWLLLMRFDPDNLPELISLPLYAIGVFAMLVGSLAYNSVKESRTKDLLRRFDHAAILVMIAGTYSPFTLVKMGGPWGIGLFSTVWGLALAGMVMAFALPRIAERAMVVLALLIGWSTLVAIKPLIASVSTSVLTLMAMGGILYTAGVCFFLWDRLRYHNAIWHAFVVIAAAVHFAAIAVALDTPAPILVNVAPQ